MLAVRLAKIVSVGTIALYMALVVFNNVTDYWTNFAFVVDVLDIEQISPRSTIRWRAITSPALHHAAYSLIILTEFFIAMLTAAGALAMTRALRLRQKSFSALKPRRSRGLLSAFCFMRAVLSPWPENGLACGSLLPMTPCRAPFAFL